MIYLDKSNTWFLKENFSTTPHELEVICQDDATEGGVWQPWDGTQDEFDAMIGCQAPVDRIPVHLREEARRATRNTIRYARWTNIAIPGHVNRTRQHVLRAGYKGTGRIIQRIEYWPESPKSVEAADRLCEALEDRVRASGVHIFPAAQGMRALERPL